MTKKEIEIHKNTIKDCCNVFLKCFSEAFSHEYSPEYEEKAKWIIKQLEALNYEQVIQDDRKIRQAKDKKSL